MRYAVIAASVSVILFVIMGIAFFNFILGYNNPTMSVKDVIGDGMLFLSILMTTNIITSIFIIWVMSNQIEKLKGFLDGRVDEIKALKTQVKRVQEDVELLL